MMPKLVNRVNNNLGMTEEHRAILQRNNEFLVKHCNIDALIPKLLEKNVFSHEMIQKYMVGNEIDARKTLFTKICKRGPKAFDHLIESLRETNQYDLANKLCVNDTNGNKNGTSNYYLREQNHENSNNNDGVRHAIPCQLPNYLEGCIKDMPSENYEYVINLKTEPLAVSVKNTQRFYDGNPNDNVYQTHSKCRGAVLIINNRKFINDIEPPRNAAEVDDKNLTDLFTQMHMYVQVHINLNKQEMVKAVRNFAQSPILKDADMAFVFVMSHGGWDVNGCTVACVDAGIVETAWIEQQFSNQECAFMRKKPKILVFQICRGEKKDYGTKRRIEIDSSRSTPMRTYSDLLIAHSTLRGYKSHRDIYLGSWYIQSICEVFMNHAHNTHVEDLFKLVDQKVERLRSEDMTMQTTEYSNKGFNKKCYLHPGIYMENGEVKKFNMQ